MNVTILERMLKDVKKHQRDKKALLEYYIQKRLNISLKNYYKELLETYEFLSHKDTKRVFKELNKKETK